MGNVAIMTDSNSGISPGEGAALGVTVVPMPIYINGKQFYEGVDITAGELYLRMTQGAQATTSQPVPEEIRRLWERCLREDSEVVYIPMSAGLSSSYQTAAVMAEDYCGRVHVVNNFRISLTQRQSVMDALTLAASGCGGAEIKRILEEQAMDACICITADSLQYLRRGGRVTGAEAMAGAMLNIKPVMEISGDRLAVIGKARGTRAAHRMMLDYLKWKLQTQLKPLYDAGRLQILISYSEVDAEALDGWRTEVQEAFPREEIRCEPLSLCIGCHTGPGVLGAGAVRI